MSTLAEKILMVRPANFGFNPQTAESNAFQQQSDLDPAEVSRLATAEFDQMVRRLNELNVELAVIEESGENYTPDSVFPNNVFSTHKGGTLCVYPMEAESRRLERSVVDDVRQHFAAERLLDLSHFEKEGKFLEGTGSLVLDQDRRIAFACLSSRTHPDVLDAWAKEMDYEAMSFRAFDHEGREIYHTNVMMCLGDGFSVACTDSIDDPTERANFIDRIHQTDRELVEISHDQMNSFAGNMLQIKDRSGRKLLLMSETARGSLKPGQISRLESYTHLASFDINTIEQCGGGSVRCMIAELF